MQNKRIAILGAGPIGVEAALAARELKNDVLVLERDRVGGNVERWGHVRLFSPFALNHSERGARLLAAERHRLPGPGDYLTGADYLERYLRPLSRTSVLAGRIRKGTRVVSVGRDGIGKNDLIGGPRGRHPFRLLVENDAGSETVVEADIVLDCTGTYGNHNWLGNGNVPALGERALESEIAYELTDVVGTARHHYAGKRVLLVGGGHSAASALDALSKLPGTSVHWIARKPNPLDVIDNDPLPERSRLSAKANALAAGYNAAVRFYGSHSVDSLKRRGTAVEVGMRSSYGSVHITVDRILAHVGYRPDRSLYQELQVHECYASLAPMKLAAALAGESSADCLAQSSKGAEVLQNPEPGFFILGAKSYGKGSNFLIRIGLAQIDEVLGPLAGETRREIAS